MLVKSCKYQEKHKKKNNYFSMAFTSIPPPFSGRLLKLKMNNFAFLLLSKYFKRCKIKKIRKKTVAYDYFYFIFKKICKIAILMMEEKTKYGEKSIYIYYSR